MNTKEINLNVSEDLLKRLEGIAEVGDKEVTEVALKILELYVGRYENLITGSMRAADNISKNNNL